MVLKHQIKLVFVLLIISCSSSPRENDNKLLKGGKTLFQTKCSSCHNLSKEKLLFSISRQISFSIFYGIISGNSTFNGRKHPIFYNLSQDESNSIKKYLDSFAVE